MFFESSLEELLKKLEEARNQFWNIDRSTALFMYSLIRASNFKNVLEIGTSNGYSGIWIAKALQITNGELVTVESNDIRYNLANENFIKANVNSLILQIKGHAPEVLKSIESKQFDLIFVDATKA
ncbi:methyltransferase, partial [Candidatus Peregrinibacteria bacterium]|nr:methyltransferase [Candidatus Peregrinibacteria bacterium]